MNPKTKKISLAVAAILVVTLSLTVVISVNLANNDANNAKNKLARVACLGDSITNETGYPNDLQRLLGNGSAVSNFGVTGAAVNFAADKSYIFTDQYFEARNFSASTVIVMLGTNDARTSLYGNISQFVRDYVRMIGRVENFSSKPQVYLVLPPPIFNNTLDLNATCFSENIVPLIRQVANQTGVPLIDVYTPLLNHSEYFSDGVHPNSQGAQIIADTVYNAIK